MKRLMHPIRREVESLLLRGECSGNDRLFGRSGLLGLAQSAIC